MKFWVALDRLWRCPEKLTKEVSAGEDVTAVRIDQGPPPVILYFICVCPPWADELKVVVLYGECNED